MELLQLLRDCDLKQSLRHRDEQNQPVGQAGPGTPRSSGAPAPWLSYSCACRHVQGRHCLRELTAITIMRFASLALGRQGSREGVKCCKAPAGERPFLPAATKACSDDLESTLGVMAGLVHRKSGLPDLRHQLVRTSGKPEVRCHPRLSVARRSQKTWMPGTRPGMTSRFKTAPCATGCPSPDRARWDGWEADRAGSDRFATSRCRHIQPCRQSGSYIPCTRSH